MTKKRAIEEATKRIREQWRDTDYAEYHSDWYEQAAGDGYEAGRIAGLREAARIAEWWHGKGDVNALLAKAAKLAKKARGK